jgi:hypothetical protein
LSRTATAIGEDTFLGDKASLGDGPFLGDDPTLIEDGVFTTMSLGVEAAKMDGETWSQALDLGMSGLICGIFQFMKLENSKQYIARIKIVTYILLPHCRACPERVSISSDPTSIDISIAIPCLFLIFKSLRNFSGSTS